MTADPNDKEHVLRELIRAAKTVAVVGLSPKPDRPSHGVAMRLRELGFDVIPVRPGLSSWEGIPCHASLSDVPVPIDIVDVFRNPDDVPPLASEAVKVGARCFWMQPGTYHAEAAAIAEQGGLVVASERCLAGAIRRK